MRKKHLFVFIAIVGMFAIGITFIGYTWIISSSNDVELTPQRSVDDKGDIEIIEESKSERHLRFEEALIDKDYETVSTALAERVEYVFDGSECCGILDKESVLKNLKSLTKVEEKNSIIFEKSNEIIRKRKEYFLSTGSKNNVGILLNNELFFVYGINDRNAVDFIFLSPILNNS